MKATTVQLPPQYYDAMDKLVERGVFHSRSDILRSGARQLLIAYGALNSEASETSEATHLKASAATKITAKTAASTKDGPPANTTPKGAANNES